MFPNKSHSGETNTLHSSATLWSNHNELLGDAMLGQQPAAASGGFHWNEHGRAMQSTLPPKPTNSQSNDASPGIVGNASSDDEMSNLLQHAARYRLATQASFDPEFSGGPASPEIDAIFGFSSANNEGSADQHTDGPKAPGIDTTVLPAPAGFIESAWLRRVTRAAVAFIMAILIGLTALAWKSYGEVARNMILKISTLVTVGSSSPEKSLPAVQLDPPAVPAEASNAASAQPAASARTTAPNATAPAAPTSVDSLQLLQSMTRDLATLSTQLEDLKASVEQVKATQQQILISVAKPSEQSLPPKASVGPQTQSATAPTRKHNTQFAPRRGTTAPQPLVVTPHSASPQPESPPEAAAEPSSASDLTSVVRPPMPVH